LGKVIEIKNLTYRYPDGTLALKGINLEIADQERVAIIGANGAGKSTLLLHLNGLLRGEGKVEICGIPLMKETIREVRKKVGLVFQSPDDQLFCPTLFDDVAFGPRNMGLSEEEVFIRVRESLAKVGLSGKERKGAFHLSQGEKKRAAFATVLAMNPQILAIDEPTGNLDPKGVKQIIGLLNQLDCTKVLVTHDLANLPKMADKVIVLYRGRVLAVGSVEKIMGNDALLREAELL
jgi:cobalt/nickel transport system ATP-binding protein